MIFKNILEVPDLIPTQFPHKILVFSIKFIEHRPKSIEMPHFYPRQGGYCQPGIDHYLFFLEPMPCSGGAGVLAGGER